MKLCEAADGCLGKEEREERIKKGIEQARAFAAGADLYRLRMQYSMAVFMLHQSAEHALHTIIKAGTGYHTITHHLERLLGYAAMAAPDVNDVFPRNTEKDLHLFRLLQKAYSGSRYDVKYTVKGRDLQALCERVGQLLDIAEAQVEKNINGFEQ